MGAPLQEEWTRWAEEQKASGQAGKEAPSCQEVDTNAAEKGSQGIRIPEGKVVVRDISKALKSEGVEISPTQVHGILRDLGLSYKRPKRDVVSDDPSYARKERELNHYKQVAPALAKNGS